MEAYRANLSVAEYRHWQLLQRYAAVLNQNLVFRLVTEGTLARLDQHWGQVDMYLPLNSPQAHAVYCSLDIAAGQWVVEVFTTDRAARITDPLIRQQQLRQAIQVLKDGVATYYQHNAKTAAGSLGAVTSSLVDWRNTVQCNCGCSWEEHDANLNCPLPVVA